MTTRKREASNNSLRNKKERIERPGVHRKGRKWKIKMYLLPNLSTPQTHTLWWDRLSETVTAFLGRRLKTV